MIAEGWRECDCGGGQEHIPFSGMVVLHAQMNMDVDLGLAAGTNYTKPATQSGAAAGGPGVEPRQWRLCRRQPQGWAPYLLCNLMMDTFLDLKGSIFHSALRPLLKHVAFHLHDRSPTAASTSIRRQM